MTRGNLRTIALKAGLGLAGFVGYGAAVAVLAPYLGAATAILGFAPAAFCTMQLGLAAGFGAIAVCTAINLSLLPQLSTTPTGLMQMGPGVVALTGMVLVLGLLRRQRLQLTQQLRRLEESRASLAESEASWRAVVGSIPERVIILDREGVVKAVNRTRAAFGEVIGTHISDWAIAEGKVAVRSAMDKALSQGRTSTIETEALTPSGDPVHFLSHYAPIFEGGQPTAVVVVAEDVTSLRQQRDTRSRTMEKVVFAQEDERRRISRQLHEGVQQSLSSLLVEMRAIEDADDIKKIRQELPRLRELCRGSLDELSALARALHPIIVEDLGLEAALKRASEIATQNCNIHWSVDFGIAESAMSPTEQLALYSIIQETLHGATRHENVSNLSVTIKNRSDSWETMVEFNGAPLEIDERTGLPENDSTFVHIGEKARLLGGFATMESGPNSDNTLLVRLPKSRARAQMAEPKLT